MEDTNCNVEELLTALLTFGYSSAEAREIASCTRELTDAFTKDAYPLFSKKARKKLEGLRLIGISSKAQTVKYADLVDNINWMVLHDKKNLRKYLRKKHQLLTNLNEGNAQLHQVVVNLVERNLFNYNGNLP